MDRNAIADPNLAFLRDLNIQAASHPEQVPFRPLTPSHTIECKGPPPPVHRFNPLAPEFIPRLTITLDSLYMEHRMALGRQMAIKFQKHEIHDILRHGYSNGGEPDYIRMGDVLKELTHRFMDAVDEKYQVIDTIEQNYGQAALGPVEEIDPDFVKFKERKVAEQSAQDAQPESSGSMKRESKKRKSKKAKSKKNNSGARTRT
ncbi:MAG: hypothetical protein Q9221_005978 [Calogaya cf. arnoldii]